MALDSLMIGGLAAELNSRLAGARIDKVTMPRRDRIILHLRAQEGNVRLLLCAGNSARVHLTREKYDNPETPPMLCMLLRKQMGGGRIVRITQPEHERLIEVHFTALDELGVAAEKRLICEMMGRMTNLILVGPEDIIIACTHTASYETSERAVQPGLRYRLPLRQEKPSLWTLEEEPLKELCKRSGGDARALCDNLGGISPAIAREMLFRGGTPEGVARQLMELRLAQMKPWMIEKPDGGRDISAIEYTQDSNTKCIKYDSFSSLLDDFYGEQTKKEDLRALNGSMVKSMTTRRNRLQRKLSGQRQELLQAEEREKLKRTADLITANLYAIRPGMEKVELTDYFDPALPQVQVTLDPLLTPQENAQRMFAKYTRLKRAEEALTRQIALGEEELSYVENVLYTLTSAEDAAQLREIREELVQAGYLRAVEKGRRKPKPVTFHPREYRVDGDFVVLCGRNNRENEELTHRRAAKTDLWFHARNVPGSHAVLLTEGRQPSELAIAQAAAIAAYFSSAANQPRAAVDYTQVRRVKKPQGARPGMVNYFEYQTILVIPALPEQKTKE